jgi:hypothetical protein
LETIIERNRLIEKEVMPAENPALAICTRDNTEWTFLQTFADYGKMNKFRRKNHTTTKIAKRLNEKNLQLRFYCPSRLSRKCKFMLLALKTTKGGYHVYKNGEHNKHLALNPCINSE